LQLFTPRFAAINAYIFLMPNSDATHTIHIHCGCRIAFAIRIGDVEALARHFLRAAAEGERLRIPADAP
jgi:hypothetical protein